MVSPLATFRREMSSPIKNRRALTSTTAYKLPCNKKIPTELFIYINNPDAIYGRVGVRAYYFCVL